MWGHNRQLMLMTEQQAQIARSVSVLHEQLQRIEGRLTRMSDTITQTAQGVAALDPVIAQLPAAAAAAVTNLVVPAIVSALVPIVSSLVQKNQSAGVDLTNEITQLNDFPNALAQQLAANLPTAVASNLQSALAPAAAAASPTTNTNESSASSTPPTGGQ